MVKGSFSQSLTGNPYLCLSLDMQIEMTIIKGSKMKVGCKNILKMK